MENKYIHDELLEDLLKIAVRENFKEDIINTPTEEFNPSEKFKVKMKKLIKEDKRNEFLKRFSKVAKRAAMYFLIFLGILSTVLILSEDVRAGLYNMVIRWFDDHMSINFEQQNRNKTRIEFDINKIPEGYEIIENKIFGEVRTIDIKNEENEIFRLIYAPNYVNIGLSLDNENHIHDIMLIEEIQVRTVRSRIKGGKDQLIWEYQGYIYNIEGDASTMDELIKLIKEFLKN